MPQTAQKREESRIDAIAGEYRRKGYTVLLHPRKQQLPAFLRAFEPDLVARKTGDNVVVEVKSRATLPAAGDLPALARAVRDRKDWRFEFVLTNPRDFDAVLLRAELPDKQALKARLAVARSLLEMNFVEAALLVAWSAAEGSLRLVGICQGLNEPMRAGPYLAKNLLSRGVIDDSQHALLTRVNDSRHVIAHGFSDPGVERRDIGTLLDFLDTMVDREIANEEQRTQ